MSDRDKPVKLKKMKIIRQEDRTNMEKSTKRKKLRGDLRSTIKCFDVGDKALLFNPTEMKMNVSAKVKPNWQGPYEVMKRLNVCVYRIKRLPKGRLKIVHRIERRPKGRSKIVHTDCLEPYSERVKVFDECQKSHVLESHDEPFFLIFGEGLRSFRHVS